MGRYPTQEPSAGALRKYLPQTLRTKLTWPYGRMKPSDNVEALVELTQSNLT